MYYQEWVLRKTNESKWAFSKHYQGGKLKVVYWYRLEFPSPRCFCKIHLNLSKWRNFANISVKLTWTNLVIPDKIKYYISILCRNNRYFKILEDLFDRNGLMFLLTYMRRFDSSAWIYRDEILGCSTPTIPIYNYLYLT